MTADLAEWLTSVWDEDEKAARAVDLSPDRRGIYQRQRPDGLYDMYTPNAAEFYVMRVLRAGEDGMPKDRQDGPATEYFRRFDPASMLARIAADRKILDGPQGGSPDAWDEWVATVRLLASVYADRPGYRDEWRV